jgi:charged multivesicular body protein 4
VLNERLAEADHVPVHLPAGVRVEDRKTVVVAEEDEDAQLKELQAALAM